MSIGFFIGEKKIKDKSGFGTYPDGTGQIREHATLKPGLFAFWCHSFVYAFAQPHVRFYVPRIDESLKVLWNFNFPHIHVRCAIPGRDT